METKIVQLEKRSTGSSNVWHVCWCAHVFCDAAKRRTKARVKMTVTLDILSFERIVATRATSSRCFIFQCTTEALQRQNQKCAESSNPLITVIIMRKAYGNSGRTMELRVHNLISFSWSFAWLLSDALQSIIIFFVVVEHCKLLVYDCLAISISQEGYRKRVFQCICPSFRWCAHFVQLRIFFFPRGHETEANQIESRWRGIARLVVPTLSYHFTVSWTWMARAKKICQCLAYQVTWQYEVRKKVKITSLSTRCQRGEAEKSLTCRMSTHSCPS